VLILIFLSLVLSFNTFGDVTSPKINELSRNFVPEASNSDITILSPENKSYSQYTGDYLNSYDFNDISEYIDSYGRLNELDYHKNIFKITYGNGFAIQNQFSRTYGTFEFYLRTEDATDRTVVSFEGDDTIAHIYFYILNDEWYYLDWDSQNSQIINLTDDYKPIDDTWHHVRIDFECTSGNYNGLLQETWKLIVDGHSSNAFSIFRSQVSPPPCLINKVYLFCDVDQPDGASYFDAFGYSWDNFYSVGDNLKEGLSILFETSFDMDWAAYSLDNQPNVEIPGNTTIVLPLNGSHVIKIIANDTIGTIYQSTERYFVISPITITYPEKNSVWEESLEYEITWTSYLNISHVDIEFYKGSILIYGEYNNENNGTFLWTVPEGVSIGTDWNIKISDTSDPLIYAISEFFEVVTAIVVLTPKSTSKWYTGRRYEITWSSTGNISFVNIEFRKGGILQFPLNGGPLNNIPNNKSYSWDIKHDVLPGINWTIRVVDSNKSSIYGESDSFEISNEKTIIITNPTSATSWERGTDQYIRWLSTGNISYVDIEIFLGGSPKSLISATENDGALFWPISLQEDPGANWEISITASDNPSIFAWSGLFEIYEREILEISIPHKDSRWFANTSQLISWTESAGSNVSYVNIDLYKGIDPNPIYSLGSTESDGELLWEMPYDPPPGDDWFIKISDTFNSSVYSYSDNFEIYTYKSLKLLSPTDISDWGIPEDQLIRWTWTGEFSHVNIEISKGSELKYALLNIENTGIYPFRLPYYEEPGNDWSVTLSVSNYQSIYDTVDNLEAHIKKTVSILDPNTNKVIFRNDYYDLVWISNGTISDVKIELFEEDVFVQTITDRTINDGRFLWHIISNVSRSDSYRIKISDADNSNVYDFSDKYFEIDDQTIPGYNLIFFIAFFSIILIILKIRHQKQFKIKR
jgi:hypothetical protein